MLQKYGKKENTVKKLQSFNSVFEYFRVLFAGMFLSQLSS